MRIYTFFYSVKKELKLKDYERFTIQSSSFRSAFKSFVSFISSLSLKVSYSRTYYVYNDFNLRCRSLTYNNILYLESMVQ